MSLFWKKEEFSLVTLKPCPVCGSEANFNQMKQDGCFCPNCGAIFLTNHPDFSLIKDPVAEYRRK